jgi:hypothetical protein
MKGFNIQTEQKQNQVTITEMTVIGTESLAGLAAGDKFEVENKVWERSLLWKHVNK